MIPCMDDVVTVAIPTLDAGKGFASTLKAVLAQRLDRRVELLVCDSGSTDGTVACAYAAGARVIEIPQEQFSHGGTRNLLMSEAQGAHVALITQDAVPANSEWLASLLSGFMLAADVGLVFGPYRPRPEASLSVRRELATWFNSLSPHDEARVDALQPGQRNASVQSLLGPVGFFTDANGAIARSAWERVPFRSVAYAEDHLLALDMLRAGYATVYVPRAAVIHSHEYSATQWLRRSFDESRAVQEVYGVSPSGRWRDAARNLRGNIGADVRLARTEGGIRLGAPAAATSLIHHGARTVGAILGAREHRLPGVLVARLSLERRR
jgi:rhamnosyltransferase